MKKLLFILLLFPLTLLAQTTYYVSNTGSDAAAGTSTGTAWQTITKVNAFWAAGSFAPGDSILFKAGDTWAGKIVVSESGTSGNPIVISSYGEGDKPVITGFETIGMWTQLNDSIDYVVIATANNPTFIAVDGDWKAMGRYPNYSYLNITAYQATNKIISTGLGASPSWVGAEAVIRLEDWILDRCAITAHSVDTLTYTRRTNVNPRAGWGFFIQNAIETLDTQFEWYYDGDTLFMHNGGESLGLYTIQVPVIDTLLFASTYDYIHVDGIKFAGSGRNAIHTRQYTDYWEIKNCEFDLNGENAIYFDNQQRNSLIDNNTINRSVRTGIHMRSSGGNTVTNNNIKNSGMLLGGSNTGTENNGIYSNDHVYGANNLFQYNEIDSSGYNGIYFVGNNTQVKNNYIKNSVLLLNDGGGIYTVGINSSGRVIEGNIVLNSYGNADGTLVTILYGDTIKYGEGIYLDAGGTTAGLHGIYDVNVINNTSANNNSNGIALHEAYNDTLIGNLVYNNRTGIKIQSFTTGVDSANYMHDNIMFARKYIDHYTFRTNITDSLFVDSDNNYFLRPVSDFENISLWISGGWQARDITYWQDTYNLDLNSTGSTEVAIDENQFIFRYNPTNGDSTFAIAENVVTIDGDPFTGDTVISAYRSAVFTIQQATDVPTIHSDSINIATRKHLFIYSNITSDGGSAVTGRGVCYSTVDVPTVDSSKVTSGTGTGTFMTRMDNLLKETTYFFRPYATNANGTKYGDMWTVTTPEWNYITYNSNRVDSANWEMEYKAVYYAMTTKPTLDTAQMQNKYVAKLKIGGVWDELDVFYLLAQKSNSASEALINWKNPGTNNATLINTPAFESYRGFTGNGTDAVINTNYNPSADGINFTQNDAMIAVYVLNNNIHNSVDIGASTTGSHVLQILSQFDEGYNIRVNNTTAAGAILDANTKGTQGLHIAIRQDSDTLVSYHDIVQIKKGAVSSTGIPDFNLYGLARNTNGTASLHTTRQHGLYAAGGALIQAQANIFYTATEEYMQFIGASVSEFGTIKESAVIFTFDDGTSEQYTLGRRLFDSLDVKYTAYIISSLIDTEGCMTVSQLQELNAEGYDIQCHSNTTDQIHTENEAQVTARMDLVNTFFTDNSLPTPRHHAYPGGASAVAPRRGVASRRETGRRITGAAITQVGNKYYDFPAYSLDQMNSSAAVNIRKAYVDQIVNTPGIVIFYAHRLWEGVDPEEVYNTNYASLAELISYVQSLNIAIKTMDEMYEDEFEQELDPVITEKFIIVGGKLLKYDPEVDP